MQCHPQVFSFLSFKVISSQAASFVELALLPENDPEDSLEQLDFNFCFYNTRYALYNSLLRRVCVCAHTCMFLFSLGCLLCKKTNDAKLVH